jgi:LPXTG-motif cell wall-anchored protein
LLKDGAAGQKIFSQFIPPIATGFGIDASAFHVTYIYRFSGEIITHNAVSKEGDRLIWRYSLDEIGKGKTISVTFRPYKIRETPVWIYALAGLVLLIVIIFLFRKKKD